MNICQSTLPQARRMTWSWFLATVIAIVAWARPSISPAATTAVVGSALSSPAYVNLYWDATWDADNKMMPKASLDAFTAAVVGSSYFNGLAEYGIGTASFAGGFLPAASCPQKAPSSVGFYDPFKASIMGFLNCELKYGGLPQGPQVVYNLILPSGSLESDLFGNRMICGGSPAVSWHFHETPYTPEAVAAIALLVATGVPSVTNVLDTLGALQKGPFYTIESADPSCLMSASFTDNLLHEMVEAASDPFPPLNVMTTGYGEIADLCESQPPTNPFVPPPSPISTMSGAFTTTGLIQTPQYWSNGRQTCITGFTNAALPTVRGVTFIAGGYPANPGNYSFTITGQGFGSVPALTTPTVLPYIELQDDTRNTRIGNALNGDPVGVQIASWTDTSITVLGATGGDSNSFWVCNPASGLCAWGAMPPVVRTVNPNGAPCPSAPISVTLTGANFYGVQTVRLDGTPGLGFTSQGNSQLTVNNMPVAIGLHTIAVDALGGSSSAAGPNFVVTPQLSASANTSVTPMTVTVTSCGAPVAAASVAEFSQVGPSVASGATALTDTNGVAVLTPMYPGVCYAPGSIVPRVGGTTVPKRTPVPCPPVEGMVSKPGYLSTTVGLR